MYSSTVVNSINTIKELEDVLKECNNKGFLDIIEAIDIPYSEFEKHFTWKEENYTRNSLIRTNDYELLVTCWESGQESPIHDYDSRDVWVHIIKGQLKEEKFIMNKEGELKRVSSVSLGNSDFSFLSGKLGLHRYINLSGDRSVCLVFFTQPLEKWNEYNPVSGEIIEKRVGYDNLEEVQL